MHETGSEAQSLLGRQTYKQMLTVQLAKHHQIFIKEPNMLESQWTTAREGLGALSLSQKCTGHRPQSAAQGWHLYVLFQGDVCYV